MNTYIKPKNVFVQDFSNQFKISKGYLHKQTITIDKEKSSREFTDAFEKFIKDGKISLRENSDLDKDFFKLAQFDLIHLEMLAEDDNLIISEKNAISFLKRYLKFNTNIIEPHNILTSEMVDNLINQKDKIKERNISNCFKEKVKNKNLYIILPYCDEKFIQAVNKVTKLAKVPYTLIFFDNKNLFATTVVHGETGCYECLEKSIISKFPKNIEYYRKNYQIQICPDFDISMYGMIISILSNEIRNIKIYGDTMLKGNVLHFYLPTYEYDFNFNKRQSSCTTCSTVNNILFTEQNMKSSEIMKQVLKNDIFSK